MTKLPSAAVAAAASEVPIDVICGILSYLPVKSVLRFRCIAKSWMLNIYDFPSSRGSSYYDLGYDSSTDDYKILLQRTFSLSEKMPHEIRKEINILSVKTNCWRMVKYFRVYPQKNAVNLNGSLNWASPKEDEFWIAKIVSFSLANETVTEMKLPCYYNNFLLGVFQGCLCLTVVHGHWTSSFTVWLMKEFGVTSSWTKVITLPQIGVGGSTLVTLLPVNHMMNKIVFLLDRWDGVRLLILDDLETEEYIIVKLTNFPRKYHPVPFSRSLISPN
ncbi:F-box protein CPR1-like [Mercurialis annua]|uniref:F-box protein CPR1-like n=1 Tax=Mercurialis annua TaxID=3986 RepID=UPI0024AF5EA2|nr:F-box protein CPR1-like [Mercurialis annua]